MKAAFIALCGAAALSPSSPAPAAGNLFKVPEGCTATVTVQLRNCQVAHRYTCSADAPGDQWAAYLDGEGPYYLSKIDRETRWMESYDLNTGEVEQLGRETDPASFSALLQSGRDDFDFTTVANTGEEVRFTGFDELTGESITIDGVTLERTRFALAAEAADGTVLWKREGNQLIHRDWRVFLSDRETFTTMDGQAIPTVDTPVEFAFPGDKGFLTMDPQYDCDVVTAQAALPLSLPDALQ